MASQTEKRQGLVNTTLLSHGTMQVRDPDKSRRFYKEFLGLDCVWHYVFALMVRKNQYFAVVTVQVGDTVDPVHVLNYWGVDVPAREAVDRPHKRAHENKDVYGIKRIMPVTDQHGTYSFYLEHLDSNWWIQHSPKASMTSSLRRATLPRATTRRTAAEVESIVKGATRPMQ